MPVRTDNIAQRPDIPPSLLWPEDIYQPLIDGRSHLLRHLRQCLGEIQLLLNELQI
jgi:hypothetical protein